MLMAGRKRVTEEARFLAQPAIGVIGAEVAVRGRVLILGRIVTATQAEGELLLGSHFKERASPGLPMVIQGCLGLVLVQPGLRLKPDPDLVANQPSATDVKPFRGPV